MSHAEEYLEAVYPLDKPGISVSLTDLEKYPGISVIAANAMVRRLQEQALLQYTPYRGVLLQQDGLCAVLAILHRRQLWKRFLAGKRGFLWDIVHKEACQIEHAASGRRLTSLRLTQGSDASSSDAAGDICRNGV